MPIIYKCPNCGAAMEFSSELQKLECKSCGTSIDVKTYEDEYASLMEEVSGSTSDNSDYGFNNSEQDNDAYIIVRAVEQNLLQMNIHQLHFVHIVVIRHWLRTDLKEASGQGQ